MNIRSVIYKSNVNMNSVGDPRVMTIGYMKDSPVVLDVGCACGDLGVALKEHRNATMFGLEYNQGSIDIALETGAYEEIHQFNLDEITENSFPQYKGKFDYIVCGDVLEHLRDPMRSLNILKSYLKEDGRIIASIPNVAHMSIKSNLLVNDFTYTPLGLLDETHIHLFTHKSIALGLSSIGLKVGECKFTLQRKVAWQPNDPYPQLSDDMKDYLFKDWHSYVCQYVMSISPSEQNSEELFNHNIKKLNIDENNAPEHIKNYRKQILAELTNTTAQRLDSGLKVLGEVKNGVSLSNEVCDDIKKSIVDVVQNQKNNGLLLEAVKLEQVDVKNSVLSVREAQAGNIEVIKTQLNVLKTQSEELEGKVVSLDKIVADVGKKLEDGREVSEKIKKEINNAVIDIKNNGISLGQIEDGQKDVIKNIDDVLQNQKNNGSLLDEVKNGQVDIKNDVLSVREAQAGNIEVIKSQFDDLKKQNLILGQNLEVVTERTVVLQSEIADFRKEIVAQVDNISAKNKKDFELYMNALKKLESDIEVSKKSMLSETQSVKKQFESLIQSIAKEKEFRLREEALLDKIERLKERRKFYKRVLILLSMVLFGVLVCFYKVFKL